MTRAVIVGAGVAGLGAALSLAKRGVEVTLLERDRTPLPTSAEEAFAWDRQGAQQVRHSHALLARLRNLLRDHHPEVLEALLEAGATELRWLDNPGPDMAPIEPQDGDEDLVAIACRRTTFEWVLRRAVHDLPGATIVDGVAVTGLEIDHTGGVPQVVGVRTKDDDATTLHPADMVVVANGRKSGLPTWLAPEGITIDERVEDTGIVYASRFYRFVSDDRPEVTSPVAGDLGYLKFGLFFGDNDTFSVTLAARSDDKELRELLSDEAVFDRTSTTLPQVAPWIDPAIAEPDSPVWMMGRLLNRKRTFVDDDGMPLVDGLHVVGDAHTCTNPLYGRGCSTAMWSAQLLAEAFDAHGLDHRERGAAYEAASRANILPWYKASVASDADAREAAREERAAKTAPDTDQNDEEVVDPKKFMKSVMREGLLPAVRTDPIVLRAFLRSVNLLTDPESLMADGDVIGRVLNVWQDRESRPPEPPMGPTRPELVALLSA